MAQLYITVDDCGLSEGINEATVALHQKGIVHAASILPNFPATQHAFALFSAYPTLEMGVHLNLNEGNALVKIQGETPLTDDYGYFRSRVHVYGNALFPRQIFLDEVEAELRAQIEVFFDAGIQPKHLSTHMHFHTVPALKQIVVKLAHAYNIPWVRSFNPMATVVPFSSRIPEQLKNSFFAEDRVSGPDHLAGVYFWRGFDPALLSDELLRLEGTAEIVVHAGVLHDPTFPAEVAYAPAKRAAETHYLEKLMQHLNGAHRFPAR